MSALYAALGTLLWGFILAAILTGLLWLALDWIKRHPSDPKRHQTRSDHHHLSRGIVPPQRKDRA